MDGKLIFMAFNVCQVKCLSINLENYTKGLNDVQNNQGNS